MNKHNYAAPRRGLAVSLAMLALAALAVSPAVQAQTIAESVKVAPRLYQIDLSPSTDTLYVASAGPRDEDAASIVALDASTLEQKSSIELGTTTAFGLGVNDTTQMLYGTNTITGNVIVVDLAAEEVVATIGESDGAHLREVVIDEQANRIYVSAVGRGDEAKDEIWVIDGETNTLAQKIEVETEFLTGAAVDFDGNRAFVTGMGANEIVAVDLASHEVLGRWPAGGERPTNAVYDPESKRLFVANQGGTLTVLDTSDGSLIESVETGDGALDVKFDAGDDRVYVTNRQAGTVSIVDATSYEIVAQLETGTYPQTIAIDRAGDRVYVSNKAEGLPRNAPDDAVPPEDPDGDTVTLIRP